jgi:hypothetical protein
MKNEFPPLLPSGLHVYTLTDLHNLTVGDKRFVLSKTREVLMKNLWTVAGCLRGAGVGEEIWVDGSFITEKIDPDDVDVTLVLQENFENTASPTQLAIWDWWEDNEPKTIFGCHSFSFGKIAVTEPDHHLYLSEHAAWAKFFGRSRAGATKGIVRILLPDGCV